MGHTHRGGDSLERKKETLPLDHMDEPGGRLFSEVSRSQDQHCTMSLSVGPAGSRGGGGGCRWGEAGGKVQRLVMWEE